jgi:hypothetical protein
MKETKRLTQRMKHIIRGCEARKAAIYAGYRLDLIATREIEQHRPVIVTRPLKKPPSFSRWPKSGSSSWHSD